MGDATALSQPDHSSIFIPPQVLRSLFPALTSSHTQLLIGAQPTRAAPTSEMQFFMRHCTDLPHRPLFQFCHQSEVLQVEGFVIAGMCEWIGVFLLHRWHHHHLLSAHQ
ncbi:hypothetical protein ACB098_05G211800 [Castanea mollissima]